MLIDLYSQKSINIISTQKRFIFTIFTNKLNISRCIRVQLRVWLLRSYPRPHPQRGESSSTPSPTPPRFTKKSRQPNQEIAMLPPARFVLAAALLALRLPAPAPVSAARPIVADKPAPSEATATARWLAARNTWGVLRSDPAPPKPAFSYFTAAIRCRS